METWLARPYTFFENLLSAFLEVEVVMGAGKMVLFSVRITYCLCSADIGVKDDMFLCIDVTVLFRTGYRC